MAQEINWDQLRGIYDHLEFNELNLINIDIDKLYPVQQQHHTIHFRRMFNMIPKHGEVRVVELGCHNGHLAKRILDTAFKIIKWTGYDFAQPLSKNVCNDERYTVAPLDDWFHKTLLPEHDVFLSSHTLEHLNESQVDKTIRHTNADYMLLEVPLSEHGMDWDGWDCSHILKWGLEDLRECLQDNGYNIFHDIPTLGIIGANKKGV